MKAIVLAGERPGGNALAAAMGVPAGVLVPVAGRPSIVRVIETLRAARGMDGGVIAGPGAAVCGGSSDLGAILETGDFIWIEPDRGPAESASRALETIDEFPVLLTTGDHALLTPATVEGFVSAAASSSAHALVGLVSHERVMRRFPGTRRTRLRFREGSFCGANLFLLRSPEARAAVGLWSKVQPDRKRPWRIARQLGAGVLLRYLSGNLAMADAFAVLSRVTGCQVSWVELNDELAAVDIDTAEDLALAEQVLTH